MRLSIDLGGPKLLDICPPTVIDSMSLRQNRDYMTNLASDLTVRDAIELLLQEWRADATLVDPLLSIREMLDSMRLLQRGQERLTAMNSFLRTLGRPELFATLLDILCDSSQREGTAGQALSEVSRKSSKHAVYGWCGQTRLILSGTEPTSNTIIGEPSVQTFLGKTPMAAWSLSMHIWQPNPRAKGFVYGHQTLPDIIAEPPHSHPFDFASVVVIGQMHQSIYSQVDSAQLNDEAGFQGGRYDGIALEHVHGVWPPHDYAETCYVKTLEDRVEMNAGDSYYLAGDTIHDVQINAKIAQKTPAITLFLRSESFVKPHVYMAPAMADFHTKNPGLKNQGNPLAADDWKKKLRLVADYVRGISPTLNLDEIVKYDSEYAFFHV